MMDLKLWLSILMVCGMAESLLFTKNFLIFVPSRIPVLESSCVDIPCRYLYPLTDVETLINADRYRGFWKRGRTVVASNIPELKLTREFHHRTRVTGSIRGGKCTWQLDGIRKTDTGPFYFRIEIPQYKSYSFKKNKVTLDVFRTPKPPVMTIEVRNNVTATCKVTHVCPTSPPKISWSRAGTWTTTSKQENEWTWLTISQPENKWMWTTTSTMTFTPQEADFNKPLECTVTFHGRKTTKGSVLVTK